MIADILHKEKVIPVDFPLSSFEEEKYTILHCTYFSKYEAWQKGWVRIHKTTYLGNSNDRKVRLPLLHAINIPYAPKRHFFKRHYEKLLFTLVFDKIPDHWDSFFLREEAKSGKDDGYFFKYGIQKTENGIYYICVD